MHRRADNDCKNASRAGKLSSVTDDTDWDRQRRENTQLAIELQKIYFKADIEAWAAKTTEKLGEHGPNSIISGYSNLCHLLLSAVKADYGVEPLAWLEQIERRL